MPIVSRRIAQAYLDRLTASLSQGDFDQMVASFAIPFRRLSLTHDALLETEEQIRKDIRSFRDSVFSLGVNLVDRTVTQARPMGGRYIEAIYRTHLLKDGMTMIQPYDARIVLANREGNWKMIETEWQVVTSGWSADLRAMPMFEAEPLGFSSDDIRTRGLEPMAAYQAHLDAIAKSEIEDDFETYISYLRFPHTAHGVEMDQIFESKEDIRPFFDMIKRTWNGEVGNHLERKCDHAEFLGNDLLVGYHTARAFMDDVEVIRPVSSRMILQWNKDRWQLQAVANTIKNKTFPFEIYTPGEGLMTDMDIQKRTQEWPNSLRKRTLLA
jgi:hypothetical protein